MSFIIAIDGPAGSGKGTVARALAAELGFTYLDTGAMYRAVAVRVRATGEDPAAAAARVQLTLGERVVADGEHVTDLIRTPEISQLASQLSAISGVRREMVVKQRQLLSSGSWVAEGRDIGTVVAPDAQVKVFLTASAEERARRRVAQLGGEFDKVLAEQRVRDQRDSTRQDSPLKPAPDAVIVDATNLTIEQVVATIRDLAHTRRA
jgi:cytidylate kinase